MLAESDDFGVFLVESLRVAPALQSRHAMRIKSLLVTLGLVGSSSLALADHDFNSVQSRRRVETTWRNRQPAVYQPQYQQQYQQQYRYQEPAYRTYSTWQPLTSIERLGRRFGSGGDMFDLRTQGRFAQLRLQNQTGRTHVRQIDIVFADGSRQCVQLNRVLEGNHAMINIQLDGGTRRIDQILVDGRSSRDGRYQLYAM